MDELPPTSHNITIVINRLLTEAQQLFGNSLITLSFARNKLWSVVPVSKVPDLFPNLRNLSLQDNDIAEYRSLDRLANRLNQLQELVLSGNPIQRQSDYRSEVAKRFPSVQFLDFQPVQENLRPVQADLPVPVQSSFFDQDNSRIAAQDMLSKFFPLFDTDRKSLIDLYDTQSTFSVVFSKGNFNQENSWGSSKGKKIK
jgi:Leucine-rich repeat (LRR) protein